jgi:glyoxylase-like metal-dependent hydrolase (beta-lactamase superfamily II)
VTLLKGDVNGVVVEKNNKKLVIYGNPTNQNIEAEVLLLTHCRRDLLWASQPIIKSSARVYVPEKELNFFIKTDSFWNDFRHSRFHDYSQQTTKYPVKSIKTDHVLTLTGGGSFQWQDIGFQVINTPGYTRGATSYIADIDGKRMAFAGDLIYGDGKIFELYSLQDHVEELGILGYHGYASRMALLIESLKTLRNFEPDIIIPVRGPIIDNPAIAIDQLIDRLQRLYSNYLSTTAYRWYTGDKKQHSLAERVELDPRKIDWMPLASTRNDNPPWLEHVNNSVLIRSKHGPVFLIDCGMESTYRHLFENNNNDNINIDGIFITHYHDDHTAYIPKIIDKFECPVYVTIELEDILSNPRAYRLPAMINRPIQNIKVVGDKHVMHWNEFKFTFYNFPGQTLYHDAMLVEGENDKIFFIGDSFSPSGMDDYCLQNRNIIQEGQGYYYCIDLLRKLPEDVWFVNQHIMEPFRFTLEQLDFMEEKLWDRMNILAEVSPWADVNYITDERWVRIYPYESQVRKGQDLKISFKILNHKNDSCAYRIHPIVYSEDITILPTSKDIILSAKQEGEVTFSISTSQTADIDMHFLTADITVDGQVLHEWCEGLIEIVN